MSSFICDPHHIAMIAACAEQNHIHGFCLVGKEASAENLAKVLAEKNIESVIERYPNDADGERPGPQMLDKDIVAEAIKLSKRYAQSPPSITGVEMFKLIDCYDYQCDELGDRKELEWTLNALRSALIRKLPGYEDASWEFQPEGEDPRLIQAMIEIGHQGRCMFKDLATFYTEKNKAYAVGYLCGVNNTLKMKDYGMLLALVDAGAERIQMVLEEVENELEA